MIFNLADKRLAEFLFAEYEEKKYVELKITQAEIARHINSARQVVARMLKHLAEEKVIEVRRGHIILKTLKTAGL